MKRFIAPLLLQGIVLVTCTLPVSCAVTEKEWNSLLAAASGEKWTEAVTLSDKFLQTMEEKDERLPRLRYIYLYTAAGKTSEGKMSFAELEKLAKTMEGKQITTPYRQFAKDGMNFICQTSDSPNKLMTTACNKDGTTILAFEYTTLKNNFDAGAHEGKHASLSGILASAVPNPNHSRAIVMRIYISDAAVRFKPAE